MNVVFCISCISIWSTWVRGMWPLVRDWLVQVAGLVGSKRSLSLSNLSERMWSSVSPRERVSALKKTLLGSIRIRSRPSRNLLRNWGSMSYNQLTRRLRPTVTKMWISISYTQLAILRWIANRRNRDARRLDSRHVAVWTRSRPVAPWVAGYLGMARTT